MSYLGYWAVSLHELAYDDKLCPGRQPAQCNNETNP